MSTEISTKTIIITGAAGNLGKVVSQYLFSKGHTIITVVHDTNSLKKLSAIGLPDNRIVSLENEDETEKFIKDVIEKYKTIDAVIMLAGGFTMGNISKTSSSKIKEQISLNFETAYHVVRPLYAHMFQNSYGRFVFIGARPAIKPADGKNMIAYGLSKSMLFKLAEYINADAKEKNINATVIVPSTIDTEANRKSMPDADPSKWVQPESIAETIEFLLSEPASSLRETVLKMYGNS